MQEERERLEVERSPSRSALGEPMMERLSSHINKLSSVRPRTAQTEHRSQSQGPRGP